MATFRTVFWSLFGRGEPGAVQLGEYNHTLTQDIGYFIYGSYNIAMVTVLLNMLIAMMTRSFTNIAVRTVFNVIVTRWCWMWGLAYFTAVWLGVDYNVRSVKVP